MIRTIIESPYSGEKKRNKEYLNRCILWCLKNNMAPIASHKMYTDALDDNDEWQRRTGISAGFEWRRDGVKTIFCVDYGWSTGMREAMRHCESIGHKWRELEIGKNPDEAEEA